MDTLCETFFTILTLICMAMFMYVTKPVTVVYATTRKEIETLLDPPGVDEETKLRARALVNSRLVAAFGIQNTFVSSSPIVHHAFVREAKVLFQRWSRDWNKFTEVASMVVAKYLKPIERSIDDPVVTRFDDFVQAVTLATILMTFFETDPNKLVYNDVVFVARGINQRWKESKVRELSQDGLDELNDHLRRWVPTDTYPNPLDYILPAFETMWRLVATTVANGRGRSITSQMCDEFLKNPDTHQFERSYGEKRHSISSMIQESLRLYPPTKHISRASPIHPPELRRALEAFGVLYREREVADVESYHKSSAWGPDPDKYDHSRHTTRGVLGNPDATILAFGVGSMRCVAHKVAPHAAGILFATIISGFPVSKSLVIDDGGGSIGSRDGWDCWIIRRSKV